MLDHHHRAAELVSDAHQQRSELFHLTLRDAGGGLVEQQHLGLVGDRAGELDDPSRPRRQLRAEVLAVRLEVEQLQQLGDPPGDQRLVVDRRRQPQRRVDEVVHGGCSLERHCDRLGDGQSGERRPPWNVRPSPRRARCWGAIESRSVPPSRTSPPSSG